MPKKRDILDTLARDDLKAVASAYEIEPSDWRSKKALVEALNRSRKLPLAEALGSLPRATLKASCTALGL